MTIEGAARRDAALATAAATKRAATDPRLLAAIKTLLRQHVSITVSSVARESQVSRPTIIGRPDIHARILRLAATPAASMTRPALTGDSAIIASLRRQIREQQDSYRAQISDLRDQIRRLDKAVALAIGHQLEAQRIGRPPTAAPTDG